MLSLLAAFRLFPCLLTIEIRDSKKKQKVTCTIPLWNVLMGIDFRRGRNTQWASANQRFRLVWFFFVLLNVSAVSFVRRGSPPDVFRGKSCCSYVYLLEKVWRALYSIQFLFLFHQHLANQKQFKQQSIRSRIIMLVRIRPPCYSWKRKERNKNCWDSIDWKYGARGILF